MKKILLSTLAAGCAMSAAARQTPNIIVIMTDQQRADISAREGYPLDVTPFLDSLAARGTWFDRAYTTSPASVPARTSFLTGRFPKATRVRSNHNVLDVVRGKDMFEVAREMGYKTAMIGKNHEYLQSGSSDLRITCSHVGQTSGPKSPETQLFDDFLAKTDYYASFEPSPYGVENQLPYRLVDFAAEWIGQRQDEPFLMWLSIAEPHNPYQVCEPYFSMFPTESLPPLASGEGDLPAKGEKYQQLALMMKQGHKGYDERLGELRSIYHGMVRLIDDQVARLVDSLESRGLMENTVILFISDHGDYAGEYGLMKKGAGLCESIARIPMQWYGPGITASAEPTDAHVTIADVFPTLCEIMGADIPAGVQGRSLWPLLTGKEYPRREFESVMAECGYGGMYYTARDGTDYAGEGAVSGDRFFDELNTWSQSGSMRMLRKGDWKLVYDMIGNGELYNLVRDPAELVNLFDSADDLSKRDELLRDLLRWEIATQDPLPEPRRRYIFKRNDHNYLFATPGDMP